MSANTIPSSSTSLWSFPEEYQDCCQEEQPVAPKLTGQAIVYTVKGNQPIPIAIEIIKCPEFKIINAYLNGTDGRKELGKICITHYRAHQTGEYMSQYEKVLGHTPDETHYRYGEEEKVHKIFVRLLDSPQNKAYKGVGTALMQAAMEYGYSKKCEGRVDLEAAYSSHRFYFKLGMRSYEETKNQAIAECIASDTKTNHLLNFLMYMKAEGRAAWKQRIKEHPIFETTAQFVQS
jgi:hypothetical protein